MVYIPFRTIRMLLDPTAPFDGNKRHWKVALFDQNGAPVDLSGGGGGHTIEDEGVALTPRGVLNFVGDGVAVTDDGIAEETIVTIPGGGGHTIEEEGVALTQRGALNFVGSGVTVTDDETDGETVITIPGPDSPQPQLMVYNFVYPGDILTAAEGGHEIPPAFVWEPAGRTVTLLKARARIETGTSVTFNIERNGAAISGGAGLVATPAGIAPDFADLALTDGDLLGVDITSYVGTPVGLTVALFIEVV